MFAGLTGRLLQSSAGAVRTFKSVAHACFNKYLLVTNTTITLCLSGAGDVLEQRYEIFRQRQTEWDPTRTRRICTTGLFIGPMCHYWYILLDRFLPGRTLAMVAKKIVIDQIVFSPVNISVFLVIMGMLESSSKKKIVHELKTDGPKLYIAECVVWPPAQLVNFYLLPIQYRVLFDNTVSLGFDFYYAFVKFNKNKLDVDDPVYDGLCDCLKSGLKCTCILVKTDTGHDVRKLVEDMENLE